MEFKEQVMDSFDWSFLCDSHRMPIWIDDDVGQCFHDIVISSTIYTLLAILSSFYASHRDISFLRPPGHLHLLTARKIMVVVFILSPLFKLAALSDMSMDKFKTLPKSMLINAAVQVFSWISHFMYLMVLRTSISISCRGPLPVVFSWMLTGVVTCIDVRSLLLMDELPSTNQSIDWNMRIFMYSIYIHGSMQLLYLCTLIPSGHDQPILPQRLVNLAGSRQMLFVDSFSESFVRPEVDRHLGVAESGSNCLTRLVFSWLNPLLKKGCSMNLNTPDDLFELPSRLKSAYVDTKFWIVFRDLQLRERLRQEKKRLTDALRTNSPVDHSSQAEVTLLGVLLRNFFWEYFILGLLKFIGDGSGFIGPLLLNAIVTHVSLSTYNDNNAFYYVAGLFAVNLFSSLCGSQYSYLLNNLKLKVRSSLVSTVYRKTLHLRASSMSSFSIGEIVNFMSTDTDRIVNMCDSVHGILIQPVQIVVCFYLLYMQVGDAFVAGIAFAIILIPLNHWIAGKIGQLSVSLMIKKDSRVKVMTELLYGIKVVKYYSWEDQLWTKISALRKAEVQSVKGRKYLDAFCVFFWATSPILIAALIFTTYLTMGNQLTVAKIFTCLALLNMLIVPLNAFPWVIGGVVQGYVSLKRVEKLVQIDEINLTKSYVSMHEGSNLVLFIRNGQFTWNRNGISKSDQSEYRFKLQNINLEVNKGQFVGICGPVGCGKTSLLLALLSEMECVGGELGSSCVADGFAYVADEPWIQNTTVKQNILFGKPMQWDRYYDIINACALDEDLKIFPAGDETFIGERGINLSGGQKARIALARALYQDKDIYLMDDIFATLDVHVAEHILDKCIHGMLAQKTRILCTHHLRYLHGANHVLKMNDGCIVHQGNPLSVLDNDQQIINLKSNINQKVKETMNLIVETTSSNNECQCSSESSDELSNMTISQTSNHSSSHEEEFERGSVKSHVYSSYALAMGTITTITIFVSMFIMQASRNFSDWWLAHWLSEVPHNGSNYNSSTFIDNISILRFDDELGGGTDSDFYFIVYCILIGSNAVFAFIRAFSFAYGGINAAVAFHDRLLKAILRASTGFFDVTPVGRIVNRFAKDTSIVDDDLPFAFNILLAQSFGLLGALVVICSSLPWIVLLLVPLAALYVDIQHYYRHTSRELKRLEAIALSPIYSHFQETVLGLTTIRAFRAENQFKRKNEERLERNQKMRFCLGAIASWLSLRLQLIGVAVITAIGLLSVIQHHFGGIDAGLVGLALSYGMSITSMLAAVVQIITETEKHTVSVERMIQYIEGIEPERWEGFTKPPIDWPSHGVVAFNDVRFRYRDDLPYALDKVTFCTQPGEKLGIVGRTGAGKSSLFSALFRLFELESGTITIDDQIISDLDIATLRGHVTIIPQDPFIFSGTVRHNVDPTNEYLDEDIWDALRQCHLENLIQLYGGLDVELAERGADFSMGQRQLLCLARAILARSKILCIDEATASVDGDTDRLLQKTIRVAFANSTVITIAHRLKTVLDSDRILVMGNATVLELDTPQTLLSNPDSHFYSLVNKQEWRLK